MSACRRQVADGEYLLEYDRVDSTQNIARALYKYGETAIIGVIAEYQEHGRGRSGSKWIAPPGTCLLATYLLPLRELAEAPQLSMTAGVAVARTIDEESGLEAGLKWPNDVLLGGRKVAGILVETVSKAPDDHAALIGIGVNLNVESFPSDLEQTATSVRIQVRRETSIRDFEERLRRNLHESNSELRERGFARMLELWTRRDVTAGRRYSTVHEDRNVEGTAVGVADSGALVLLLDDGRTIETVSAVGIH